jgi:hypothetical protein
MDTPVRLMEPQRKRIGHPLFCNTRPPLSLAKLQTPYICCFAGQSRPKYKKSIISQNPRKTHQLLRFSCALMLFRSYAPCSAPCRLTHSLASASLAPNLFISKISTALQMLSVLCCPSSVFCCLTFALMLLCTYVLSAAVRLLSSAFCVAGRRQGCG